MLKVFGLFRYLKITLERAFQDTHADEIAGHFFNLGDNATHLAFTVMVQNLRLQAFAFVRLFHQLHITLSLHNIEGRYNDQLSHR